jgi:broad specificity phosphatase PhoE
VKVALIRHATTESSVVRRLIGGGLDEPLSEQGRREADAMAEAMIKTLRDPGAPGAIATSNLRRASETAESLGRRVGWEIRRFPGLGERHFGEWTGKTLADLVIENPAAATAFRDDPLLLDPPGGERTDMLVARVTTAWAEALGWASGKSVLLVVTHDGPIRVLLRRLVAADMTAIPIYGIATGATYWLRRDGERWELERLPGLGVVPSPAVDP